MGSFINSLARPFFDSWLDFLFPRICFQCDKVLSSGFNIFCDECLQELHPADPEERCRGCFRIRDGDLHCPFCKATPSPFYQVLSVYNLDASPAFTLQRRYQNFQNSFLTEGAAGLMAESLVQYGKIWPDCIIPLPSSLYEKATQGFSPSYALASYLTTILNVPILPALKAKGLFKTVKYQIHGDIEEKNILLVGDQMTPEFFQAGEAIAEGVPQSISGITFTSTLI